MRIEKYSFEFFPPKTSQASEDLLEAARMLKKLNPLFATVTFGAAGSTKSGTFETVKLLMSHLDCDIAAHISYFGSPKKELFDYTNMLWNSGIRRLVALRGDIPQGIDLSSYEGDQYFHFTSDFVEALLNQHPFDISVGAYPEKHPDALTLEDDIQALKLKCNAGAARALTQFFFDIQKYAHFTEKVQNADIKTSIVPGILPINDFSKIQGFAKKCGAAIPLEIAHQFENSKDPTRTSLDILKKQLMDLENLNIPHVHIYTLNKSSLITSALKELGRI